VARESIGTSLQVAKKLGGATGARLAGLATHAYLSSMRVTYAVTSLIVISAIAVAYKWLPAQPVSAAPATPDAVDSVPAPDSDTGADTVRRLDLGVENAVD
jgi:hypothetical protein